MIPESSEAGTVAPLLWREKQPHRVSNLAKVTQTMHFESWDSNPGVLDSGPGHVTTKPSCLVGEEGNGGGGGKGRSPLGLGPMAGRPRTK